MKIKLMALSFAFIGNFLVTSSDCLANGEGTTKKCGCDPKNNPSALTDGTPKTHIMTKDSRGNMVWCGYNLFGGCGGAWAIPVASE
jgi:hypothetical protein